MNNPEEDDDPISDYDRQQPGLSEEESEAESDDSSESLSEYSQSTVISDNVPQTTGFKISKMIKNASILDNIENGTKLDNIDYGTIVLVPSQGCEWSILCYLTKSEETNFAQYLSLLVKCDPLHSNTSWKVAAKATITLFHLRDESIKHSETQYLEFTSNLPISGFQPFIRWSSLESTGFRDGDDIRIGLDVEDVQLTGCFRRKKRPSVVDRASVLNDHSFKRKHFNHLVLCLLSGRYERKQRNIPFYNPDKTRKARKHLEMLMNVYVARTKITDENIDKVLLAAKYTEAWGLLKECLDHLVSPKCRLSYEKKLAITNKYSLKTLEANLINERLIGPGIKHAFGDKEHYKDSTIESLIDKEAHEE